MYDDTFDWLHDAFFDCEQRLGYWWHKHPVGDEIPNASSIADGGDSDHAGARARIEHLRSEALQRLGQVRWCIRRVQHLEREGAGEDFQSHRSGSEPIEIEVITEAFYLFAHRFLDLCSDVPELGLRGIQSKSVRVLRNKMIVHADDPDGVSARNFGWDLPGGPHVKPYGPGVRPKEAGLYRHASELVKAVQSKLQQIGA